MLRSLWFRRLKLEGGTEFPVEHDFRRSGREYEGSDVGTVSKHNGLSRGAFSSRDSGQYFLRFLIGATQRLFHHPNGT